MSLFKGLTNDGLEETTDNLGGGFQPLETDAYLCKIKAAYAQPAANSKALGIVLIAEHAGGEYRETIWVSNKKGENFFLNKQDNSKKVPLPGFTTIDDLCVATTERGLAEQDTEDKVFNVYDRDAGKEIPKSVPMLVDLIGKEVTLGIVKQTVNKQRKNDDGDYVDTEESRDENTIDKVFHYPSNVTIAEARNEQSATFYDKWVEKNRHQTRDKRKIKDGQSAASGSGRSGRPSGAGGPPKAADAPKRKSSLFA